eukprot:CCRYP_020960-RA/>CCRYP_020960-RA protein AED:0.45 eAED:1.00 QI:0/-1/0/1/-1/0/1/0/14
MCHSSALQENFCRI